MNYVLLLMAFLGLLLKILIRYNSGLKLAVAANAIFNPKVFLKKDWLSIAISVIAVAIAVIILPDIKPKLPEKYHMYINLIFVPVGYMGGDMLMRLLNRSRKSTIELIDRKTNSLDYEKDGKEEDEKDVI